MKLIFILTSFTFIFLNEGSSAQEINEESVFENQSGDVNYIFTSGTEGYSTFRIPAIVTLKSGKILAFAEGRVNGSSDTGNIDMVMRSSEDGGNWKLGGITPQDQVNECTVAELPNGKLILNMRNYDRTQKMRKISFSKNGGLNWSDIHSDKALIEPICQASLLFTEVNKTLWFTNPESETSRTNMTLKASYDFGKTWKIVKVLNSGASAYSNLNLINTETLGILYEGGKISQYEGIVFCTFEIK